MSSRDYWARRAEAAMDAVQAGADKRLIRIGRAMMAAQDTLTAETARILGNYMRRYGLTAEEAKAYLEKPVSRAEWNRLLVRVGTMPEGREKREMLAKMSSGAYRYRITRAEALRANVAIETARIAQTVEDETTGQLKWTAAEAYQRSMFDTQMQEGVGFAAPNMQGALEAVGAYWAAGNYKDSCWTDKARLTEVLETQISEAFLSGKSYAHMARVIQDEFGVSFRKAERLVRTETSYVAGQSRKKAYQDAGRKRYRYLTALDKRTCDRCGPLDRELFDLEKAEVGVNYPPLHPNCRCTTIAIVEGREGAGKYRRGRDANGKGVLLPKDMTYTEWKAWQAAGCPEDVFSWLGEYRKPLNASPEGGTMSIDTKAAGSAGVRYVGKIDREIYKCVTPDITTDEVIITDERIEHCNRHKGAFDKYSEYIGAVLADPDLIIEDSRPNTAILIRRIEVDDRSLQLVLRLHTSEDDPAYQNSIISFWDIVESRRRNYERNRKILYKRD